MAYFKAVRQCRNNQRQYRQTTEVQNLCRQAHVDLTTNCGGFQELRQFQHFLMTTELQFSQTDVARTLCLRGQSAHRIIPENT